MSTPASNITVCTGTGLNNRYQHTVYHTTELGQQFWFAQRAEHTFQGYTYLRKNWDIQVPATMDAAIRWDYLYFKNNTKTYYYFITNVEYVNDANVRLSLELDVMQTYFFDYVLLPCHIDRQHTTTDNFGEHIADEGLELGEMVFNTNEVDNSLTEMCILVLSSKSITDPDKIPDSFIPENAMSAMYGKTFSGLWIYAVSLTDVGKWGRYLDKMSADGYIDCIVNMWMYPKSLVTLGGEHTWTDDYCCKLVKDVAEHNISVQNKRYNIDGYQIRNNKLLCYPYQMLYASNNTGGQAIYHYERFKNAPRFRVTGSLTPDGGARIIPLEYNGVDANNEEGLNLTGYPTCAWDSDTYKVWLAQNQNQHAFTEGVGKVKAAGGAVSAVASALTGNAAGVAGGIAMAASGLMDIQAQKAAKADMSVVPPQARGSLSSSITMSAGFQNFSFYNRSVDAQHAKQIDDFFTMYGYKINKIGVPNIHAREGYTFIKTNGCNIRSNLNATDAAKIMSVYDAGITFWVTNIGNYDHANSPITE